MIHETAIVDLSSTIADDVVIGSYSVIGPDVKIGSGCNIASHVVINGPTYLGKNNKIYQFSSIGGTPQDKKFSDEETFLKIGDDNVIRENCTINRGTVQGGGLTKMGNNNLIMAYVHIAHDCIIGNNNTFANNSSLAGHVVVDNFVVLGGFTLISQFSYIGSYTFSAMGSVISQNIPPYVLVSGHMAKAIGVNVKGLRRRNFSDIQVRNIRKAYKLIYRSGLQIEEAEQKLQCMDEQDLELSLVIKFLDEQQGGIIR
ncbi:MAG: acyl-ACP--UDP-N-acetylglucosamine O-acyltransferase [Piscirickettsiaceae bacterium]|nr:acyl-ACP--UDP-N-acetylglucosamine O-acyltransferase [Piscirickettsiaceae bacterium]